MQIIDKGFFDQPLIDAQLVNPLQIIEDNDSESDTDDVSSLVTDGAVSYDALMNGNEIFINPQVVNQLLADQQILSQRQAYKHHIEEEDTDSDSGYDSDDITDPARVDSNTVVDNEDDVDSSLEHYEEI